VTDLDASDEATGLAPLDQPDADHALWAMVATTGQADVLSPIDSSPQGCCVLSVRGLNRGEWAQIHITIPHGGVTAIRDHLNDYLAMFPEGE